MSTVQDRVALRAIELAREDGIPNPWIDRVSDSEWHFRSDAGSADAVLAISPDGRLSVRSSDARSSSDPSQPQTCDDGAGIESLARAIRDVMIRTGQ